MSDVAPLPKQVDGVRVTLPHDGFDDFGNYVGGVTVDRALKAAEVAQRIRDVVEGRLTRYELSDIALEWLTANGECEVEYDLKDREIIADTVLTLLAMDEGPQFELTDEDLSELIRRLVP